MTYFQFCMLFFFRKRINISVTLVSESYVLLYYGKKIIFINEILVCLNQSYKYELRSWRGVFGTTLRDNICQWLVEGWLFCPGTPVSSPNKTDHHYKTEILLKVALKTITNPEVWMTYSLVVCRQTVKILYNSNTWAIFW